MDALVILLIVTLLLGAIVFVAFVANLYKRVTSVELKCETRHAAIDLRVTEQRNNLVNILKPIRQNTESIDLIDDDLNSLEAKVTRELLEAKKREFPPNS